jgi:phosphoenolpyruvate carboxykinase (ATP)
MLIGDDEHGWDDKGIFNFEGGCYAKVIKLSQKEEPEIFNASHRFSSILENVVYDEQSRKLDLDDDRYTKNTRSSYDISFIPHACLSGKGGHPNHIVMLTCDAFGVLPPVSKLDPAAATYYFINGYTAKVAGTERGISEPEAVFSACFGAPFMAHFPIVYARLLKHKMEEHKISCWLLNTGWTGCPHGVGSRMKISWSRAILHAILDGRLTQVSCERDPIFNLQIPTQVPEIPKEILLPRNTWTDGAAYDAKAKELAKLFRQNFKPYSDLLPKEIRESGPVDID